MSDVARILIVTPDPQLREELLSAVASAGHNRPVTQTVESMVEGVQAARNHPPGLVIVEMPTDLSELQNFAATIKGSTEAAKLAAVIRPETVKDDAAESQTIIAAIRAGVDDFLRRPISSAELAQLLSRIRRPTASRPTVDGQVLSFISNKGGVGKSTVSVNTAVGLALDHPDEVLLIDASLQLGVAASMLNVQPRVTLSDAASERTRLDETMLRQMVTRHESGLHLLSAPPDAVAAAAVDDVVLSRVVTLARRVYRYTVVDTFPVFDKVVLAVLDLSDRVFVVLENVVPTVQGIAKLLEVLDRVGLPPERRNIVLNRMTSLPGGLTPQDIAARLNASVDYCLPYDKRVIAAANVGQPFAMRMGGRFGVAPRFGRELKRLVRDIEALASHPNGKPRRPTDSSSNGLAPPQESTTQQTSEDAP